MAEANSEAKNRQRKNREKAHYDPSQPHKILRLQQKAQRLAAAQAIAKALLEAK